jgi:hypothetical protein
MTESIVLYYVRFELELPVVDDPEDYLPFETAIRDALQFLPEKQEKEEAKEEPEEDDDGLWQKFDESSSWVSYKYSGQLSQQQLDRLIEIEYRNSLKWINRTGSVSIDDQKFPIVIWECPLFGGGILYLYVTLFPPLDYPATDVFKDGDTFLSFIQQRYAGTHDRFCRCEVCREKRQ